MMITVDLNAPSIRPDRRVWRLFPGAGYRFLDAFEAKGVGFLDIPGFPFPDKPLSEATDLTARIAAMQAAISSTFANDVDEVEADPSQFALARNTKARGRLRRSIINFYEKADKNDIVVVPEPGNLSQVWIGRFQSKRIRNISYDVRDWNFDIAAREIEWIRKVRENMISTELSESLRNQHAFTALAESLHVEVYSLAYASFVKGETYVASIFNSTDYLDADSALLGLISRLASAACFAIDNGFEGLGPGSDLDIIFNTPPLEYTCSHEIDIHSPGFNRYVSGKMVPLVTSSVLATMIAVGGLSAEAAAEELANVRIINTSPDADPTCNPPVAEATKRILEKYPIAAIIKMCHDAVESQKRAGLNPSARAARGGQH
jgi:hypothetical protein